MPVSSGWPLKPGAIRFFVPLFASRQLRQHPLTESLYINGMGLYPCAEGHLMERSDHEDHLLMYCSAGKGYVSAGGKRTPVSAGQLILIPKGTAHEYGADSHTPWTLYWVHFSGTRASHYIEHIGLSEGNCVATIGLHPKIVADFESIFDARETGYNMKALIHASQCLKQFISYLAMLTSRQLQPSRSQIDLAAIQTLMKSNLHGDLELETLAELAHLSKYHFSKRYKEITGYAPIQHFIHLKMERACYLLDVSSRSVAEVAETLGYDDAHYFSRLFKKVTGLSPREYRKLENV
ncbi:AraC family transcriptional regulator [Ketobacter sp. MCCC 1A13808]|uniref:AraC family transcriptional regulator n=1 Tax=Ketobacter sp. MCCC 1A13808 TaxID=2602738 RepID=UPI000F2477AB|nr:AraC family transcriptional regulator [Ketobacter sp. MCCC 1A13808]MVF14703.1 AraC family transcriptional regulator [Ketobacter sp. MCCC 1A13808]RLP53931.1 MAG: AraC family transcriptional regulator [Ketobacter sp.]